MVFPTPLFESFFSFMIFIFLMKIRKREMPTGRLFFIYMTINGVARFMVEFIRLNPTAAFGMTHAQIIGIFFVITGIIGIVLVDMKARKSA